MSTEPVTAEILGQTVEGTVLDRLPKPDITHGPREIVVVAVGESTYRVEESDVADFD